MVLDYIFPPLGGLFFAFLWGWMFKRVPTKLTTAFLHSPLIGFPLISSVLDWGENVGFFYTAWTYPDYSASLLGSAIWFREMKLFFMNANFVVTGVLVVLVLALWLIGKRSSGKAPQ